MARTRKQLVETARRPLPLAHYGSGPTFPDRPTLGLKALQCPFCRSEAQRLMRAHQYWRDMSDIYCAQIGVKLDFLCRSCEKGWQIDLFNEDEGIGEIIMVVKEVATVNAEDAEHMAEFVARQERAHSLTRARREGDGTHS